METRWSRTKLLFPSRPSPRSPSPQRCGTSPKTWLRLPPFKIELSAQNAPPGDEEVLEVCGWWNALRNATGWMLTLGFPPLWPPTTSKTNTNQEDQHQPVRPTCWLSHMEAPAPQEEITKDRADRGAPSLQVGQVSVPSTAFLKSTLRRTLYPPTPLLLPRSCGQGTFQVLDGSFCRAQS